MLFLGLEAGLWNDLFSISTRRGEAEDSLSLVAFLWRGGRPPLADEAELMLRRSKSIFRTRTSD